MCAPMDMKPACPKDNCPTVIGRNMLSPMIMLIPIVMRSASPRVNRPVKMLARESITTRIGCSLLPARFDLQATAEQPRWLIEENQDEDAEGKPVLPGGHEIGDAHRLDHAQDQRRHHGPDDVPRPAEEHDRQALEAQV